MCGITGGWSPARYGELLDAIPRMTDAIAHRGPDDSGSWGDPDAGVALGHRRLSIIDTSEAGHQPMLSASGRWVIAYNGEVYNHEELRKERARSPGHGRWRGHSDTETLLECVEAWGLSATLKRSVGMFAIALWDRRERCLWLARDRFGEKPLYYGLVDGAFVFGSELKSIRQFPGFSPNLDPRALALYMEYGAVPSPLSIYQRISKLPPGSILKVTTRDLALGAPPEPIAYWDACIEAVAAREAPFRGDEASAISALEEHLTGAVRGQMISDVPLGSFLSGGIDSSLVTALMQRASSRPVKTFSIGFRDDAHDEAKYASAVASHLSTEHTEFYVSPHDALSLVPDLHRVYDEPFADSSQIPTIILSRLTRNQVTVALSGDGGDELFFGYERYIRSLTLNRAFSSVPGFARRAIAGGIRKAPLRALGALANAATAFSTRKGLSAPPGDRLLKLAPLIEAATPEERYRLLMRYCDPKEIMREPVPAAPSKPLVGGLSFPEWMMLLDTKEYMPNDILVKVDRAAMSASLETRTPFLDHRVFEFAWKLPLAMKEKGSGKHLLRQLLFKHVPRHLVDRPKSGFNVPLANWLRGPLKPWASDLLASNALRLNPYLDSQAIWIKWSEHQSGLRNWHHQLWTVLMYLSWQTENNPGP